MLLGYNTNGLQNHRLDDALHLLADRGYRAVALTLDVQHLDPFHSSPAEVDAAAGLFARLGLLPVIETGARFLLDPLRKHEPTLMSRADGAREQRLDFYARAAAIGQDLGAEVLSFWAGVDHATGPDSWAWLCEGVRRTCELARRRGLLPALEPEPGMAVATLCEFERLCAELGEEAPALTLDVGHLYVTETGSVPGLVERWAPRAVQVHLEDIRRGVHEHLVPGEGDVEFGPVLRALKRAGYRRAVCFELSRSSHMAPVAVEICRDVWQEVDWT